MIIELPIQQGLPLHFLKPRVRIVRKVQVVERIKVVTEPFDKSKYVSKSELEAICRKWLKLVDSMKGVYPDRPNQRYMEGIKTPVCDIVKTILRKELL